MLARQPRRGPRPLRRLAACIESLDARELPSGGVLGPPLGASLTATTVHSLTLPRVSTKATLVDPHTSINQFLSVQLGPGVDTVEQQVETQNLSTNAALAQKVLANTFIHSVLSRQDTYTLLNSVATTTLQSTQTGGTTVATVTYVVPQSQVTNNVEPGQSLVAIAPTGTSVGFFVTVPTDTIRIISESPPTYSVPVPVADIPAGGTLPSNQVITNGTFSDVYMATGPIILSALRSSVPHSGPNAPRAIPGLRLAGAFANAPNFPGAHTDLLLRAFRVAVDRNVFALGASQSIALNAGIVQFENTVAALNQAGTFQPPVPPAAPALPRGALYGTLEVSIGALRNLSPRNVASDLTGLQLPNVGNFPGRIDVGYVFDRKGNFGIALTARGPLAGVPKGVATANVVGGDVQVSVSNAPSLAALDGQTVVEGLDQGTGLSGGLSTSTYASGIKTFAASAGYGSGLEFGTGVAFTEVIPLGNVYALIPEAPNQ